MAEAESTLQTLKQNVIEYVRLQLGDQIVDIELDALINQYQFRFNN